MLRTDKPNRSADAAGRIAALLQTCGPDELAQAGRVVLSAMLTIRHLDHPVDLARVLEMAVVGALNVGDFRRRLDADNGLHLHALRLELESGGTSEAKLVRTLSALADERGSGVRDRFLQALVEAVRDDRRTGSATG